MDRRAIGRVRVAAVRRKPRIKHVLHQRYDGQSKGRFVQPSLNYAARDGGCGDRRDRHLLARYGFTCGADVSCQRVGLAVFDADGRQQNRVPRRAVGRQIDLRIVRAGKGQLLGWRAHRVANAALAHGHKCVETQYDETHRDWRLCVSARYARRVPRQARRDRKSRVGHDRDEPDWHLRHAERKTHRRRLADAASNTPQAGSSGVRR